MNKLKIDTFGSCLSRYTANHYVRIFGGRCVTSVYHNRSDAFVSRFIDCKLDQIDFDDLAAKLIKNVDSNLNEDNKPKNILKNQYEEWMGLHRLSSGTPFLKAIESTLLDVLFVDNYMDLAGRLVSESAETGGYFLRLGDFSSPSSKFVAGSYLSPEEGVSNMKRVIQ